MKTSTLIKSTMVHNPNNNDWRANWSSDDSATCRAIVADVEASIAAASDTELPFGPVPFYKIPLFMVFRFRATNPDGTRVFSRDVKLAYKRDGAYEAAQAALYQLQFKPKNKTTEAVRRSARELAKWGEQSEERGYKGCRKIAEKLAMEWADRMHSVTDLAVEYVRSERIMTEAQIRQSVDWEIYADAQGEDWNEPDQG